MGEVASGVYEGQILAGKYRVDRVLGAGAMGVVVAAHHQGLDTPVAIKFLMPGMLENAEAVDRFAREARAAAKINNEHVTRVLDVGTLENGAPYIVMELLEGSDLQSLLKEGGPLPVDQAVDFVLQAGEAVAEAHALGIVHRDLKPSNMFCVRRSNGTLSIKVLDFGISKMNTIGASGMTRSSIMMGTPLYMSPEQMESARSVDARADIWALGVVLFQLLTGELPFSGETLPEICLKVTTRPPPAVRSLRPLVPAQIEAAIFRCLEKDRDKRWPSVGDMCAAIAPFGSGFSSAQRRWQTMSASMRSATVAASESRLDSRPGSRMPSFGTIGGVGHTASGLARRGRRFAIGAAGAILGLAVATFALVSWLVRSPGRAPPSAASASTSAAVAPPGSAAQPAAGRATEPLQGGPGGGLREAVLRPADDALGAAAAEAVNPVSAGHGREGSPGEANFEAGSSSHGAPAVAAGRRPRPASLVAVPPAPNGKPHATPEAPQVPPAPATDPAKGSAAYDERL
ncbi:MAG TPA: protein kinase [Polyangiaceae bacterium]|nr:protein kinase [Polyangiaceae bacterium]